MDLSQLRKQTGYSKPSPLGNTVGRYLLLGISTLQPMLCQIFQNFTLYFLKHKIKCFKYL